MFEYIKERLRGIHTPAWMTGMLRGIVEAVAFAAVYAGVDYLTVANLPDSHAWLILFMPLLLRSAEGYIDHIDPIKARRREAADKVS